LLLAVVGEVHWAAVRVRGAFNLRHLGLYLALLTALLLGLEVQAQQALEAGLLGQAVQILFLLELHLPAVDILVVTLVPVPLLVAVLVVEQVGI
jgi:hypothetical protein